MSSSMASVNDWLHRIGSCRQYLTRLTISKSGANLIGDCYELLADAGSLQLFEITLPSNLRASLDEHMDKHWEGLKHYLLAHGVDRKESLLRLDTVQFRIGPSQNGILNSEGDPMKEMTPERQQLCKTKLRGKVLEYFVRKVVKLAEVKDDSGHKKTALSVQHQEDPKDRKAVRNEDKRPAVTSQRQRPAPVIVIDDD